MVVAVVGAGDRAAEGRGRCWTPPSEPLQLPASPRDIVCKRAKLMVVYRLAGRCSSTSEDRGCPSPAVKKSI